MSMLSVTKQKLGQAANAAYNFLWDASAANGSLKMTRENGQDILTVDSAGKVSAPQGFLGFDVSLSSTNGYVKFPTWCFSGLIIQFGVFAHGTADGSSTTVNFPIAFPAKVLSLNITPLNTIATTATGGYVTNTGFTAAFHHRSPGSTVGDLGTFVAFGY